MLLPRLGAVANKGIHGVWQVTIPPLAVNLEFIVAELATAVLIDVGFRTIGRAA